MMITPSKNGAKNGGVHHLKTPKKKPEFGWNTHVTLNPKPRALKIHVKKHATIFALKI
jgi:hypothetical protein